MRFCDPSSPSCLPEGAAVSIGPVSPGQTDEETHIYLEPSQKNKSLHVELIPSEAPCPFALHLTLQEVEPNRKVLVTLQLLLQTPEGQKTCALRLVPVNAHSGSEVTSIELPPVGFLLPALAEGESGHYLLRIAAHYS